MSAEATTPILWSDEYRSIEPSDYVGHEDIVEDVYKYKDDPYDMPNMGFTGVGGIGKTTLALMFGYSLGDLAEVRTFNSDEDKNQAFVENLKREVSVPPVYAKIRLIVIDEVSEMSTKAQTSLRALLELDCAWNKYILIYNYPAKMVAELLDRLTIYKFRRLDKKDIIKRLQFIVDDKGLIPQENALSTIADRSNGSLRRAINLLQRYTRNKFVAPPIDDEDDSVTSMFNAIWDTNFDDAWDIYLIYQKKGRYVKELPQMFINVVEKKFSKNHGMKALLSRHIIQFARDMSIGLDDDVCVYGFFGSIYSIAEKQQKR